LVTMTTAQFTPKIITGSALEIFSLLTDAVEPSSVMNEICDYEDPD